MKLLPILLAALAGCATAADATYPYSALGTEPFWSIEIDDGRIAYETPYGSFSVPAPPPQVTATGRRFEAERITVDITPWVCTDGMSDNLYADTVTAVVDGVTLYGCGGGTVPADVLVDSSWAIEEIDGIQVWEAEDEEGYRLAFRADRLNGRAGCNLLSAGYSRSGDRLALGPIVTTRMACPEPRMEHERRALQVLNGTLRLDFRNDGSLVLTGAGGSLRLQRSFHAPYSVTATNPWEPESR